MEIITETEKKQVKETIEHLECYELPGEKLYALGVLVELDKLPRKVAGKICKYLNL